MVAARSLLHLVQQDGVWHDVGMEAEIHISCRTTVVSIR